MVFSVGALRAPTKCKLTFWMFLCSDIYMYGKPYTQCPRRCLKRQIRRARAHGFTMKSGIERESPLSSAPPSTLSADCQNEYCVLQRNSPSWKGMALIWVMMTIRANQCHSNVHLPLSEWPRSLWRSMTSWSSWAGSHMRWYFSQTG